MAVVATVFLAGSCLAGEAPDCTERAFVPSGTPPPGNLNANHWLAHQAMGRNNIPAAQRYMEAAVAEGAPYVATMLGDYVERGICVPANPRRALELYRRDAVRGDDTGMLLLGMLLLDGRAGVTDSVMAEQLFRAVTSRFPKPKDKKLKTIRSMISPRLPPAELEGAAEWAGQLSSMAADEVIAVAHRLAAQERPEYEAACNLLFSVATTEGRFELGRLLLDDKAGFPEQSGYALRLIYDAANKDNVVAMEFIGRKMVRMPSLDNRERGLSWLLAAQNKGADVADVIREAEGSLPASRVVFARNQAKHGLLMPPNVHSDVLQPNCLASSDGWRAGRGERRVDGTTAQNDP